ncbi:phospholipase [Cytobacillus sp. IB215665]|uniref:phospholipase n=1 Tax=Cytobacillus sp. IB215665 TaxID=3097357 RepID=UPI002A1061E0|nr:phospholipase [Cytobacillus sp. IB215665]MDX8366780.1 phospholipase [Cytobacillus sp. IB215665]
MRPRRCLFPGYRWCGPGCSGPGAPINDVDAACKAHDECYRIYGRTYECDLMFVRQLRPKVNPYTEKGRHAQLMYNFMKSRL